MSTRQEIPRRKCRQPIESGGSILAWPCDVDEDHEGPCAAKELPRSMEARRIWEAARDEATISVAPTLPTSPEQRINHESIGTSRVLPIEALGLEQDRIVTLRKMLGRLPEDLPRPAKEWMFNMMASVSLAALWDLSMVEFEKGALAVTITPEFLVRLIPPSLQNYIGRK